jgi:hypothetical protein
MRRLPALLSVTVLAGLVCLSLASGVAAFEQPVPGQVTDHAPSLLRQLWEVRQGLYKNGDQFLAQLPRAVPAYVAGGLAVVLLAHLCGFFEMGATSIMVLIAAIGAIVCRFYWPWH